ncbi:MAG: hypothetical protein ACFBSD_00225 [Paracoccaceae bacterium]
MLLTIVIAATLAVATFGLLRVIEERRAEERRAIRVRVDEGQNRRR